MRHVFEQEQLVRRPRSEVFAFFADAANLEHITPRTLRFEILTAPPITMKAGALIDYQLRLYGIPFRWQTRIECFEPESRFVDEQLRGPYRRWHHEHTFVEVPGGTLVRDRVDYEVPLGPIGELARVLFVERQLRSIFEFRRDCIERLFASGARGPTSQRLRKIHEHS